MISEQLATRTAEKLNAIQDGPKIYQPDMAELRERIILDFLQEVAPEVAQAYEAVPARFQSWSVEPRFK